MTKSRYALFLLLAFPGCKGKAPTAYDAATAPPPAPADAAPPSIDAAVDDAAAAGELRFECPGGEKSATVRAVTSDSAELVVAHAGHFSQTHRLSFDGEQLRAATVDDTSWSFSGGLPDNPETTDKVKRVEYTFAAGAKPSCRVRTAEGPSKEIEALLAKAPAKAEPCAKAAVVEELATHVRAGEAGKAELVALVCR
jgi:hypothetical protein